MILKCYICGKRTEFQCEAVCCGRRYVATKKVEYKRGKPHVPLGTKP